MTIKLNDSVQALQVNVSEYFFIVNGKFRCGSEDMWMNGEGQVTGK